MRTLALLAFLTVAALAFAGCTGSKGNGTSTSSSSSHSASASVSASVSVSASASGSASGSHSSSGSSTGPANHAPVGSISASAGNGSLPLNVNFTLSGSDQDHDTLSWGLVFGDGNHTNGTSLPSTVAHKYTKAGNVTAVYTLTDGKTPVSYNVTINVKGGSGGGATLFTFAGTTKVPNPIMSTAFPMVGPPGADFCAGLNGAAGPSNGPTSGVDCVYGPIDAAVAGKPFTATSSAGDSEVQFWDTCDETTTSGTVDGGAFIGAGEAAGVVPAGAGCVIMWDAAAAGDLSITVTA